jgi:hypothetical protein
MNRSITTMNTDHRRVSTSALPASLTATLTAGLVAGLTLLAAS